MWKGILFLHLWGFLFTNQVNFLLFIIFILHFNTDSEHSANGTLYFQ